MKQYFNVIPRHPEDQARAYRFQEYLNKMVRTYIEGEVSTQKIESWRYALRVMAKHMEKNDCHVEENDDLFDYQWVVEMLNRPLRRGDCEDSPRPCPYVSCSHHMLWAYYEGFIHRTSDEDIVDHILENIPETCVLDVAKKGGVTLQEIAKSLNMTRERVRQIEGCKGGGALRKLRHPMRREFFKDFTDDDYINRDCKYPWEGP